MRDYCILSSSFWTGETGKRIRKSGNKDAIILAVYLLSCNNSNMIGLYYLPIPTISHETGLTEAEIMGAFGVLSEAPCKPLASPFEGGFAYFDPSFECVFIPEMARFQIGEEVNQKDNRHKGIIKEAMKQRKSPFFQRFWRKYEIKFHLPPLENSVENRLKTEAPPKGLASPSNPDLSPVPDPVPDPAADKPKFGNPGIGYHTERLPEVRKVIDHFQKTVTAHWGIAGAEDAVLGAVLDGVAYETLKVCATRCAAKYERNDTPKNRRIGAAKFFGAGGYKEFLTDDGATDGDGAVVAFAKAAATRRAHEEADKR